MPNAIKIILIVLCVLTVLIISLTIATPHIVFNFIFKSPPRTTKIPKYYIGTPHYNVSQAGLKVMRENESEDVFMKSRDGLNLHAYLFPCEEGVKTKRFVLSIHGYRSYARPEFAPYYEFYRSLGFNALLPDDRAHRRSEGDYIGFGVLDRFDCVDWANYLVEEYGENIEIILHGVSMGGATVASASGTEGLPSQVIGVVCDCGFSSGAEVLDYQLREVAHLPSKYILPRVEKIFEKKTGYNLHTNTAKELVSNSKVPILFVQGMKDTMVPPYMVDDLFEACQSEKRILKVDKAGHGESIAFDRENYEKNIIELFGLEKYQKNS